MWIFLILKMETLGGKSVYRGHMPKMLEREREKKEYISSSSHISHCNTMRTSLGSGHHLNNGVNGINCVQFSLGKLWAPLSTMNNIVKTPETHRPELSCYHVKCSRNFKLGQEERCQKWTFWYIYIYIYIKRNAVPICGH